MLPGSRSRITKKASSNFWILSMPWTTSGSWPIGRRCNGCAIQRHCRASTHSSHSIATTRIGRSAATIRKCAICGINRACGTCERANHARKFIRGRVKREFVRRASTTKLRNRSKTCAHSSDRSNLWPPEKRNEQFQRRKSVNTYAFRLCNF